MFNSEEATVLDQPEGGKGVKRKGFVAKRGLEESWSEAAGARTVHVDSALIAARGFHR
jgi:hypothetical protein